MKEESWYKIYFCPLSLLCVLFYHFLTYRFCTLMFGPGIVEYTLHSQ